MVSFLIRPVPSMAIRFGLNYHLRKVQKLKYVNVSVAYTLRNKTRMMMEQVKQSVSFYSAFITLTSLT